ncbi:MAG: hypothetical protein J6R85_02445 [Lentisphaeria bacterium]|nr:hypothetical protein [Lentisphaeria bacterium]
MIRKWLGLFLCCSLLTVWLPAAQVEVAVDGDTVLLTAPRIDSEILGTFGRPGKLMAEPVGRVFLNRHPLSRYSDFYKVQLPEGRDGYFSPDVWRVIAPDGSVQIGCRGEPFGWITLIWAAGAGALLLLGLSEYKARKEKNFDPESAAGLWRWTGIAISLRVVLLATVVYGAGNLVCNAADEPGYFQVARDLLDGKFAGPWTYTVGLGALYYLPVILLTGAQDFLDVSVGISFFSGFVVAPLTLLAGGQILRKLGCSNKVSAGAVLIWALLPFFYHHCPDWNNHIFLGYPGLPSFQMSFVHYMSLIGAGFNGMSDTFSTLLVFLAVWYALSFRPGRGQLAGTAAVFALSCLVRLNNIFMAPLIGWILLSRHWEAIRKDKWYAVQFFGIGAGVFLAIVGIQFYVNYHQFGDWLTFPYSLHALNFAPGERPADGFTLHTLLKGINLRYLCESNFALLAAALGAVIVRKPDAVQGALVLWAFPMILFFGGYSHTFCDPVRFIMVSFLPLAAMICRGWEDFPGSRSDRIAGAIALGILCGFALPRFCARIPIAPWGMDMLHPAGMLCRILPWMILIFWSAWCLWKRQRFSRRWLMVWIAAALYCAAEGTVLYTGTGIVLFAGIFWIICKFPACFPAKKGI